MSAITAKASRIMKKYAVLTREPRCFLGSFDFSWEQRKLGECFSERVESMPDGELISVTINDGIKKFSELGRHDNSNDNKSKYKKVCVGDIAYNSMRMWQGASGYSYCIRTIGDLAKTDPDFLNRRLGKNGIALWQYANGNDRSRVMNADFVSPVKSVGHGITTIEDLENDEQVWPVFLELTQDIGHKLRVHKKCADGVAIHIRDNTLFSKQWQMALDMPTQSPMLIAKAAFALFEKRYDWRNPIRSVTIQAINLVPQDTPRQVDLFMNIEKIEKAERLDQCIETIRQRFGKNSIRNGILFQNLRMPSEKPEITMPTGVLC